MTDNTSNNFSFVNSLADWGIIQNIFFDPTENHFRCFAYAINLAVQKALGVLDIKLKQVSTVLIYKIFIIFN